MYVCNEIMGTKCAIVVKNVENYDFELSYLTINIITCSKDFMQ